MLPADFWLKKDSLPALRVHGFPEEVYNTVRLKQKKTNFVRSISIHVLLNSTCFN